MTVSLLMLEDSSSKLEPYVSYIYSLVSNKTASNGEPVLYIEEREALLSTFFFAKTQIDSSLQNPCIMIPVLL